MADEEEKPIRVVDRRMFTADGELRPEYRAEEEETPAAGKPAAPAASAPPPPPESAGAPPSEAADAAPAVSGEEPPGSGEPGEPAAEPRTAFALIVQMLAMPAYAALGLVPDPATGRARVDRAAAREMIDLLAVLEQKTRGNLSFEESNFVSRVLYDLRLAFVEVSRKPAK